MELYNWIIGATSQVVIGVTTRLILRQIEDENSVLHGLVKRIKTTIQKQLHRIDS